MKKGILLSLLGLIVCLASWAQMPTKGSYYRIKNASYGSIMSENWGDGTVTCVGQNNEYNQLWQYTAQGALQNVYTGNHLQDQSSMSNTFRTGSIAQPVSFTKYSDGHFYIATLNNHYLHCDAARNIVYWWDNTTEPSHWILEEVELTQEEVDAAREEYANFNNLIANSSKHTATLRTFFTNDLCTELNPTYAAMSDDELKAAMAAAGLPTMLQDIAVKVKNQWWNDTDKTKYADKNQYAKDFRVASYKPYSDANNWRDKMNTYAPSFMGNPTGIYATNKDVIHVFVGNDIPANATLYLTPLRNHGRIGSRSEGTQLKKGYNAIVATTDSLMYFINYVVNTIPTNNVTPHTNTIAKISDFPDLDIHIEGGQCVGYYQKPIENSAEEDAKFQYLTKNANRNMYFVVKGATSLFYFRQQTYTQVWPKTIWNSIDWFDRVHFWEFGLIGVLDDVANGLCENGTEHSKAAYPFNITGGDAFYPTYCNNPTMAIEGPDGKNPHATTFYTSYPGTGSVESSFNAERANFDNWCVGHEHGHQIQAPYNLESCSESSVNLPSNIVTCLTGYRLGRGWSFAQNYAYVAENKVFGLRDISITMRMYYNLFLYYHIGGKKKDFYPTFVKSLREDPMNFSRDGVQYEHPEWGAPSGGHHRAVNTWIKFYKKACDAAQEDLTEYFRLWGFFVPCDKEYFGDYTSYAVSLTQEEIDAAIAEVKAKGYPENLQIMFVEDRQILRERTDIWANTATGTKKYKPTNWEEWYTEAQLKAEYGDVGDILTYIDGSANTSEYTYILSGNKLKLTGNGGVGFIVYDKEGNNVYMTNYYNFEIPAELAAAGFTIKAINADGTSSEVTNGADLATDEEKLAILQAAISAAKQYSKLEDVTGKKVGFYRSEDIATLKGLVADAEAAIAASSVENYLSLANALNSEVLRLQTENLMISIQPNSIYRISCVRKVNNKTRYLTATSADEFTTQTNTTNYNAWAFVPTEDGMYYLQNRYAGKLVGSILTEKGDVDGVNIVSANPALATPFKINNLGEGKFVLRPNDNTNLNMHNQGYITVWYAADEGSQWEITLHESFDEVTEEALTTLIESAKDLVSEISEYSLVQNKYTLQADNASSPGYISTNASDAGRVNNQLPKAVDAKTNTFFISNYTNNSSSTEYHNLKVDLGSGISSDSIQFETFGHTSWSTISGVEIYASNDNSTWTKIAYMDTKNVDYVSDVIASSKAYRYWRFDIVSAINYREPGTTSKYPWFVVREFNMYDVSENLVYKPEFSSITTGYLKTAARRIREAEQQLTKSFKTPMADYVALYNLTNAYENLLEKAVAIDPTVDVSDIEAVEDSKDATVYDLSGRKLGNASGNGIYIIGGKKIVK